MGTAREELERKLAATKAATEAKRNQQGAVDRDGIVHDVMIYDEGKAGRPFEQDNAGPYYIINKYTEKHCGPFSTNIDAIMARTLDQGGYGWANGEILNKIQFEKHLKGKND